MSEAIAAALSTANRGAISELRAGAHLLERGYHVFWSMSPACPVDLVAWRPGEIPIKVEVKTVAIHVPVNAQTHRSPSLTMPWPRNDDWDLLLASGPAGDVHEFWAPIEQDAVIDQLRQLYGFPPVSEKIRNGRRRSVSAAFGL